MYASDIAKRQAEHLHGGFGETAADVLSNFTTEEGFEEEEFRRTIRTSFKRDVENILRQPRTLDSCVRAIQRFTNVTTRIEYPDIRSEMYMLLPELSQCAIQLIENVQETGHAVQEGGAIREITHTFELLSRHRELEDRAVLQEQISGCVRESEREFFHKNLNGLLANQDIQGFRELFYAFHTYRGTEPGKAPFENPYLSQIDLNEYFAERFTVQRKQLLDSIQRAKSICRDEQARYQELFENSETTILGKESPKIAESIYNEEVDRLGNMKILQQLRTIGRDIAHEIHQYFQIHEKFEIPLLLTHQHYGFVSGAPLINLIQQLDESIQGTYAMVQKRFSSLYGGYFNAVAPSSTLPDYKSLELKYRQARPKPLFPVQ